MVAWQAPRTVSNEQAAAAIDSGMPRSLMRELGDDAERALGADEQMRQVVAGARISSPGVPVLMISPSPRTTFSASTLSRMVP